MDSEIITTPENWDNRTERLLGNSACQALAKARVLVVGLGGVGGYATEMLIRSGIGNLCLIDADNVDITNLNRQIIALQSNIGESKAEQWRLRALDINPNINIDCRAMFITPENVSDLLDENFDFVVDCIDTVAPKVSLLAECLTRKIPVISSMGAGGRIHPEKVIYTDLWSTANDGLARAVREGLKRRGLRRKLPVVASTEVPQSHSLLSENKRNKRSSYGTIASLPATFGILLANHVIIKLLTNFE